MHMAKELQLPRFIVAKRELFPAPRDYRNGKGRTEMNR